MGAVAIWSTLAWATPGAAPPPPPRPPGHVPSEPLQPELPTNPQHPLLNDTLSRISADLEQIGRRDLPRVERARLALEIRSTSERLPTLTHGEPDIARQLALSIERGAGRLLTAVTHGEDSAVARQAGELSAEIAKLRAVLGP
jgi:hypothetical protein